jgi:hypothetical protein
MVIPANGSQRAKASPEAAKTTRISVMTKDPTRVLSAGSR